MKQSTKSEYLRNQTKFTPVETHILQKYFYSLGVIGIRIIFFFYRCLLLLLSLIANTFNTTNFDSTSRVVVIGGGFGGAYAAKKLQRRFHVTLIDTKDYFEFTPSVLRTIVEPNHLKQIQIPHNQYLDLHKATIYNIGVDKIERNYVSLKSGEKIDFDYLVLTAGSTYNIPFKESNVVMASRGDTLTRCSNRLVNSKHVLIIGGGIVGVELAGEICETFPDKEITIVHAGKHLMSSNQVPEGAVEYVTNFFRHKKVNIILKERVIQQSGDKFVTNQGRQVISDLAFLCTGIKSNASILDNGPYRDCVNKNGFVRVNQFLQLHKNPHIFVAGDISDLNEEKLAQSAEGSARIAVKNLIRYSDKDSSLMTPYRAIDRPKLVSLGRYDCLFIYKWFYFGGIFAALMKEVVEWKVMTAYRYRSSKIWL